MSKQLATAAAFSVFAMTALALFAPDSARLGLPAGEGAAIAAAARPVTAGVGAGPFAGPAAILFD